MSTETTTEPRDDFATEKREDEHDGRADVAGGGIMGAVGGGIIGAFAGGPIGAVIGAVVGAGASAAAVDYVDHHEHDSGQTVEVTEPAHFDHWNTGSSPVQQTGAVAQVDRADVVDYRADVNDEAFDGPDIIALVEPIAIDYMIEEVSGIADASVEDIEEVVRLRAYQLWEERGHVIGQAERDWYDAEAELLGDESSGYTDDLDSPVVVEEVFIYSE